MEHLITHMDLDTFFVSVERLLNRELAKKPILIGGVSDRGVVASCSYETRLFGIHSGMPMKMARMLCPEAIILRGNTANYTKFSDMVTEIIKEDVPLFEKSSIDEFYIDMTGMDRFFSSYQMVEELRERIVKETHLPISFGFASSKTVAKMATNEIKPGKLRIETGKEKPFLAPLSVKKIPMVGDKTYQTLFSLGLRRIKTVQNMPIKLMEKALGLNGVSIWKKANGIDNSPVIPHSERKSISTERTFERDTIDVTKLKGIITAMVENLTFQLRRGQKVTSCITVKIRYSDFNTYTKQLRLPYTAADHILIPTALALFEKLYNRRLLVRLIGVKCSHLVGGSYQINLFDDAEEMINLYQAMDHVRKRFGERSVMLATGMEAKTIGRLSQMNPFSGGPPPLLANRRS
jgi:DNA polymerase-4